MQKLINYAVAGGAVWGLGATAAAAGVAAPAPILGAGLPGLAMLGVAGVGYLIVRARRNSKD